MHGGWCIAVNKFYFNTIQLSDNIGYAEAWKDVNVQCNAIQGNEMQFCDKRGSVEAQKAVNVQCNAVQFNIQCNCNGVTKEELLRLRMQ